MQVSPLPTYVLTRATLISIHSSFWESIGAITGQ